MDGPLLSPEEVAVRWKLSVRTLANWRSAGRGPSYMKIEGRIHYRLQDIERFERTHVIGSEVSYKTQEEIEGLQKGGRESVSS